MKGYCKLVLRFLPGMIGGILIILLALTGRKIEPEDLMRYIPAGPFLAAPVLLAMYAIKSISVFLPMLPLQLTAGFLFPPLLAVLINTAGYALGAALSWRRGHKAGVETMDKLMEAHPRLSVFFSGSGENYIFLSFLLRVIGMIPMDVTSMYLGFTGVAFFPYLLATVAGALPKIIAITLMGDSITRPSSPAFIYSAVFTAVLSLLSALLFYLYRRRAGGKASGEGKKP